MWKKASAKLIALFTQTMEKFSKVEQRKMFGYPCCFVNDNMFTGLYQESWVVRLSDSDRELAAATYSCVPFEPMPGRIMKEYIVLPQAVVLDPLLLKEWVEKSYAFASALPPKEK